MQETTIKVKARSIELTRVEGTFYEVDRPYVTNSDMPWDEANTWLLKESVTAPEHGGYDKVDFTITFEDGETYSGHYVLKHFSKERPDLIAHVRDFVRFSAGIDCPPHMTEESWREYLHATEYYSPGVTENFARFYRRYNIGELQMLTPDTAREGQRVEVWQHPNVEPVPHQGERGVISSIHGNQAAVRFFNYAYEDTYVPVAHLRPVGV